VATAAGGVPEVVRHGCDGLLVPVGDGAALGAAIADVLSDRGLRNRLVASGRERVREFSMDATTEATLREYRMIMRERSGGALRAVR
jgi:glycosyltransferase involved in cell wall biosynthesis